MRRTRRPAQDLRAAIDGLPLDVRQAVLEGIQRERIIAGAHVDGSGGVCPMVAADVRWRSIGASSVKRAQAAARAWDQYAEATSGWHQASKRQLLALRAMLEASILEHSPLITPPLSQAGARLEPATAHGAAADARPAAGPSLAPRSRPVSRPRLDTGERERTSELRHSSGWSWLRLFRDYDDYEDAMRWIAEMEHREALAEQRDALSTAGVP